MILVADVLASLAVDTGRGTFETDTGYVNENPILGIVASSSHHLLEEG